MTQLTLGASINAGIRRMMERDPRVLVMGEDVGGLGGVFRVTDGLQADFGRQRVLDTPLAESGIVGTAIGISMTSGGIGKTELSMKATPASAGSAWRWPARSMTQS